MHFSLRGVLWLVAALLALVVPVSVHAGSGPSQSTFYNVGGWTETVSGCTRTNMWLGANLSESRFPPAARETSSSLTLELEQYDICVSASDPPQTFSGVGDMDLDKGMLTGSMQSAALHVTVSLWENISGTRIPVALDLHWTGLGDVTNSSEVFHFGNGVNCHSTFASRDATLSGTVDGGGIDVAGTFERGGSLRSSKEGCTNQ